MTRLVVKGKRLIWDHIRDKYLFNVTAREEACRQAFFYNAFHTLAFNGINGDYAEFGCCGGMTFAFAFHESRRSGHLAKLWAFDSFQGLPTHKSAKDEHPVWKEGLMATSLEEFHAICKSNKIPRDAYSVIAGFYDQTLTKILPTDLPNNIALAYIDCDLYSSAKTVLEYLMPRIKHGMIIAFDDYFCWSPTQISGERLAMLEVFSNNDRYELVPYIQFGWHGNSFVVEDKKVLSNGPSASTGNVDP